MQTIVDRDLMGTSKGHECFRVGDRIERFEGRFDSGIEFSLWMKKLIVRVNEDYCETWGRGDG